MTPEQFCYWLQGYFELGGHDGKTDMKGERVRIIKDHLDLVFKKVTPDRKPEKKVISESKPETFETVIEALKVDPFTRPDVYCAPNSGGNKRIC